MKTIKCMSFILVLLSLIHLNVSKEIDVILSLQKYFRSKLVLLSTEPNNSSSKNIAYYLMKQHGTNFFTGNGFEIKENAMSYSGFNKPLFVSLFNLNHLINLLQPIESYKLKDLIWIYFLKHTEDLKKLGNIYIPYDCQFIVIKKIGHDNYKLIELYKLRKKFETIQLPFGYYQNGLLYPNELGFYNRRINLNGLNFTLALSTFESWYLRQHTVIWDLFQQKMNFSWNMMNSEPLGGGVLTNGTATGVFKVIEDNKVDGSLGHFVVSTERIQKFDFVFPTRNIDVKIFLTISRKFNWTAYIAPFKLNLWLVIISWAASASLCILTINKSLKHYCKEEKSGSFFVVIKILCYQGGNLQSPRMSLLISWLMPYFIAIIVVQTYSGSLQSHLTIQDQTAPFKNLEEVIKDGNHKITTISTQFVWFFFLSDTSKLSENIRSKYLLPYEMQPKNPNDGFDFLCASEIPHAFVCILPVVATTHCKIVGLETPLFRRPVGLMFVKNFPFTDVMSKQLQRIFEAGLILESHQDSKLEENIDNDEGIAPLSLDSVKPLFYLHISALILGLIVLTSEILIHRRIKKFDHIPKKHLRLTSFRL